MNIAFITKKYPESYDEPIVGGNYTNSFYLSKSLDKLGHNVFVITQKSDNSEYEFENISVVRVQDGVLRGFVRGLHRSVNEYNILQELKSRYNIDLVHCHATTSGTATTFMNYYNLFDLPVVFTLHGTNIPEARANLSYTNMWDVLDYINSRVNKHIRHHTWTRADEIISVSEYQLDEMSKIYDIPSNEVNVITNGVDTNHYYPGDSTIIKEKYGLIGKDIVIFVGRMARKKGMHVLLEAIPKVLERNSDAEFLCVCGTPDTGRHSEEITKSIQETEYSGSITMVKSVPESDLPNYYRAADVAVVPSVHYESGPTVVYEGMASGLPVIAPPKWGIDGQLGNLDTTFKEGDSTELASKICWLLSNKEIANKYGNMNRKRAVKEYDWGKIAIKVESLYNDVLSSTS